MEPRSKPLGLLSEELWHRSDGGADEARGRSPPNNEIGIAIGGFARDWSDVVSAGRKAISGSAADAAARGKTRTTPVRRLPRAALFGCQRVDGPIIRRSITGPRPSAAASSRSDRNSRMRDQLVHQSQSPRRAGLGRGLFARWIQLSLWPPIACGGPERSTVAAGNRCQ